MSNSFSSLEKAIDILSLFDLENKEMSASEISEKLGMPLSTTYKYLDIFLKKDFLAKDRQTRKLYLGLAIFRMGNLAAERFPLAEISLPFMQELSELCGETILLAVVHGMEGLCIEVVDSPRPVKLTVRKGTVLPLHISSMSKILLAYKGDEFVEKLTEEKGLPSFDGKSNIDINVIMDELKEIRKRGYAQSDSEVDPGAASISVPIFNHKDKVVAGLTIVGPAGRILGADRDGFRKQVTECANAISGRLSA